LRTGLKKAQPYARFMNSPSVVSITVMPAVNSTGRHTIAYHGMCWEASTAVVASKATSVAVSKPSPNRTPTGYSCHSLLMALIQRPKNREKNPRLASWRSSSASS
jgi:hypothetical protein